MHPDTILVNNILTRKLVGAAVESFGLTHQFLTLTFRDDKAEDHTLWLDTEISSNYSAFDKFPLDETAKALLLFNSVNLKTIIGIQCNDEATLEILFENKITLTFSGIPTDESCAEPWSIGPDDSSSPDSYGIISMHGGSYSVFGAPPELI